MVAWPFHILLSITPGPVVVCIQNLNFILNVNLLSLVLILISNFISYKHIY